MGSHWQHTAVWQQEPNDTDTAPKEEGALSVGKDNSGRGRAWFVSDQDFFFPKTSAEMVHQEISLMQKLVPLCKDSPEDFRYIFALFK